METTPDKMTSQRSSPTLQLERPLLSIDEYAAREGVSRGIVEECGKLGVVQIRKYKGKAFVVDVPLSPYSYTPEATAEPTQPVDKTAQAQKISELVERMLHRASEITDKPMEGIDDEAGPIEDMPEPTQILNQEAPEAIDQLEQSDDEAEAIDQSEQPDDDTGQTDSVPDTVQTPELQTLEVADEPPELIDQASQMQTIAFGGPEETVETKEEPGSTQVVRDSAVQPGLLTAQTKSKPIRRIAAVLLLVCFFAALFGNLWLYMDRKVQLDRIDRAYASIQQLLNGSAQASQQVKTIQSELDSSRAQAERIQNELDNSRAKIQRIQSELDDSKAQVKAVRGELAGVRGNLETIQQRDAEAVKQLNEQIQKFSARLAELIKNRRAPPPSPAVSSR